MKSIEPTFISAYGKKWELNKLIDGEDDPQIESGVLFFAHGEVTIDTKVATLFTHILRLFSGESTIFERGSLFFVASNYKLESNDTEVIAKIVIIAISFV